MKENKKLYIDASGYTIIEKEVENLNEELKRLNLRRSEVHKPGTDIRWDNAGLRELERSINVVVDCLKISRNMLRNVEILDNNLSDEQINFNDFLKIRIFYSEDDSEDLMIKLVGVIQSNNPSSKLGYEEVSINSPLGIAIYGKKIGDKVPYMVEKKQFSVEILERIVLEQEKNIDTVKTMVKRPNNN